MILSTKILRMEKVTGKCAVCNSTLVEAFDPETEEVLCVKHVQLEDLDPHWPANQSLLAYTAVSRRAMLPTATSFSELADRRQSRRERGERGVWVSSQVKERLRTCTVDVKPYLEELIHCESFGGQAKAAKSLDKFYYLQVRNLGENIAHVMLKYQEISGSRLIAIVPWDTVTEFFGMTNENSK